MVNVPVVLPDSEDRAYVGQHCKKDSTGWEGWPVLIIRAPEA